MTKQPADPKPQRGSRFAGMLSLLAGMALAACNGAASDDEPGGVSEGEARALDEAAEMLDRQQLPEDAVPPIDVPDGQERPSAPQASESDSAEGAQEPE